VIEVSRAVDYSMDFNCQSTDDVEDKVGFNYQNAVAVLSEFWMARYSAQERMLLEETNPFIEPLDK
jgi:hypothetical protein